jgi:hypothetical protein
MKLFKFSRGGGSFIYVFVLSILLFALLIGIFQEYTIYLNDDYSIENSLPEDPSLCFIKHIPERPDLTLSKRVITDVKKYHCCPR